MKSTVRHHISLLMRDCSAARLENKVMGFHESRARYAIARSLLTAGL